MAEPLRIQTIAGDNPTPFYLHFPFLPPLMQWVFPFTYGFSYPLPQAVLSPNNVQVNSKDTPSGFPPAPVSTAAALLTAFDDVLPYSAGKSAQSSTPAWAPIGGKTLAAGADNFTTQVVPPTTKTLCFLTEAASNVAGLSVVGSTSGVIYLVGGSGLNSTRGMTMIPVNGLLDSTYVFTVSAGNSAKVDVYATDALVPTISQGQMQSARSLPVVMASDQPSIPVAVQGGLNSGPTATVGAALAAIGSTVLVAAVLGQQVYIFGGLFSCSTATAGAFMQITDTAGGLHLQMLASVAGNFPFNLSGVPLGAGLGARITVAGAAGGGRVDFAYSQG